jgi:hypothetical protein
MEHRGGQLGHLNGRMTLPASLPLGDMPMEALDAALAGLDDHDPHHELALDQAAMDLHDNDEACPLPLLIIFPARCCYCHSEQ